MRILFINPYYYPNNVGGTESVVKLLAEQLAEYGNHVAVYTVDSSIDKCVIEENNGVKIYRGTGGGFVPISRNEKIRGIERIKNAVIQRINFGVKNELETVLHNFCPDIVNTQNLYGFSSTIWRYIKLQNISLVHTLNDYWILNRSVRLFIKSNAKKYVDYYIAPSQYVHDLYDVSNIFNCSGKVISNGIKLDKKYFENCVSEKLNRDNNRIVKFLFVGQLEKIKGLDILIEVFKRIPYNAVELHICGKGNLKELVEQVAELDKRIIYHGFVLTEELEHIYRDADVLVAPSIWEEPFGMVALEAYYRGLTVIAGNRGGLRDILKNVGAGKLINSSEELLETLKHYSNCSNIKKDITMICDRLFEYSVGSQATGYLKVFEDVLNQRH